MITETLRPEVLKVLGLTHAEARTQNAALEHLEIVSQLRMARIIADSLTLEQLQHIEVMKLTGMSPDVINEWISANIPHYAQLSTAVVLDSAEEAVSY